MPSQASLFTTRRNIVYGMVSGTALLGDLCIPTEPNGLGLLHIPGSGWHATTHYGTEALKESRQSEVYAEALAALGFTVFTINHRAPPYFHFPAALNDAQRALRFFRHNATAYGIDADCIGAIGGSSGGNLVSLLGVLGAIGDIDSDDPVEREDSVVGCVVARAAPHDLINCLPNLEESGTVVAYLGRRNDGTKESEFLFKSSSPIYHVSKTSPPFLLIHGTAHDIVPYQQSVLMQEKPEQNNIPVHLIPIENGGHGPEFDGATNLDMPNLISQISGCFLTHLKG